MVSSIIACIIQCITSFWLVYPNNLFMRLLCFLYHLCSQVVLLGDLNYRISLEGAETRSLVKAKNWAILLENDQVLSLPTKSTCHLNHFLKISERRDVFLVQSQLLSEFSRGRHFEGWQEGLITFSPTYKYHPNSDQYYWCFDGARGQKKRAPAWWAEKPHTSSFFEKYFLHYAIEISTLLLCSFWVLYNESCKWHDLWSGECDLRSRYLPLCRCDRILWRGKGLKQVQYETCNYRLSDHRPVRAVFHAECDVSEEVQK